MRCVVQRVKRAQVTVDEEVIGKIDQGLVVLVGVAQEDSASDAQQLAEKVVALRIFDDEAGKTNLSLQDVKGALLIVSQFTLMADCRQGRRPGFTAAAEPERANILYEAFVALCKTLGVPVQTGRFRANMQVELVNDGPFTILLDSKKQF